MVLGKGTVNDRVEKVGDVGLYSSIIGRIKPPYVAASVLASGGLPVDGGENNRFCFMPSRTKCLLVDWDGAVICLFGRGQGRNSVRDHFGDLLDYRGRVRAVYVDIPGCVVRLTVGARSPRTQVQNCIEKVDSLEVDLHSQF